ncbi:MAG: hypothetical protein KTR18_11905 [Acidiferrobacterales bacterium]|nr:hypothetical protein [Acidiferrobacterales bacterium]
MSATNYRVIQTAKGFGVFKVYYDSRGKPYKRDVEPVFAEYSNSACGLLDYVERIQLAFEKDSLAESDIG